MNILAEDWNRWLNKICLGCMREKLSVFRKGKVFLCPVKMYSALLLFYFLSAQYLGAQLLSGVEFDIRFYARVNSIDVDRNILRIELLSDKGGYFDLKESVVFELTNEKFSVGEIGLFDCLTVWNGRVKEYYILDFEKRTKADDNMLPCHLCTIPPLPWLGR